MLQTQLEAENRYYQQALDEERDRCERLEEQINDLTELHQHEVTNIKQVRIALCLTCKILIVIFHSCVSSLICNIHITSDYSVAVHLRMSELLGNPVRCLA
jgi:Predicted transmembrane and coiled-coil 2 protein